MKRKLILTITMTMVLIGLTACHDDTDDRPVLSTQWAVSLVTIDDGSRHDPSLLSRYASYESVAVTISGLTADTRAVIVTSDAQWLKVQHDTLAVDFIVSLATTDNRTEQRRTATLTFADADRPEATTPAPTSTWATATTSTQHWRVPCRCAPPTPSST